MEKGQVDSDKFDVFYGRAKQRAMRIDWIVQTVKKHVEDKYGELECYNWYGWITTEKEEGCYHRIKLCIGEDKFVDIRVLDYSDGKEPKFCGFFK